MLLLQPLHKYSSFVLFACLRSAEPSGSSVYSSTMNNAPHLMSDGKIIVSHCRPHISRSAQFTKGHSVISRPLHASHWESVIGREARPDLTQTHSNTNHCCWPLTAGCHWSLLIAVVRSLPEALLTTCWIHWCLHWGSMVVDGELLIFYAMKTLKSISRSWLPNLTPMGAVSGLWGTNCKVTHATNNNNISPH